MTGAEQVQPASRRRDNVFWRFGRSRKGVAAIEFGMVAIPFLGLLCAIFETAFVFFTHEAFDMAVASSARKILVNTYQGNSTPTAGTFKANVLCPAMPTIIACAKVVLNVQAFNPTTTSFTSVSGSINQSWYSANSDTTSLNLGQPGYIVVFQAFYPMPVFLSVLVASGSNGAQNLYASASSTVVANPGGSGFVHAIFSTAVFRNEPQ